MKFIRSFSFAWSGIRYCFAGEVNFKVHCFFAAIAILLGIGLNISSSEWLVLMLTIAMVISLEMINTAIEKLCDKVQPAQDAQIKIIKDMSAAAVLIAAAISLVMGSIIFLPKLFN